MISNLNNTTTLKKNIDITRVLYSMQDSYIIMIDTNGLILFLNKEIQEYKYLDLPLQMGSSFYESLPEAKRETIRELIRNLRITGQPFRTNVEKVEQGLKVHFEVRYSPVLDELNNVEHILIEARDVSAEKIFSNKIRRVANDFTSLVENANAIIIGTDSQGYITDWNDLCERITGFSKRETFAYRFSDLLLSKEQQGTFSTIFNLLLKGELLTNHELSIQAKDGRLLTLLVNGTPRKNVLGNVDGILFVGQDVTELTDYRKSLERKVKERTHKLHELNLKIRKQKDEVDNERKKSDILLQNILPESVAKELKIKGVVAPRYFPSATILFADLVGFTKLSEGLNPDDIVFELNNIFVGFDLILEKHGVEKIKTIGDGYLGVGGLPIPNATHASDTIKAGLEIVTFLDGINKANKKSSKPPWQVRVGIHTGELVAGVIGRNKFAYDVWGAAVNTASRMESAGEPGQVNVSHAAYALTKDQFKFLYRGVIDVKGMGELQMYYVEN